MTDVVKNQIETKTLERYDSAMRNGDIDWLNSFWDDVSERTGYTKTQLINSILDEYINDQIGKTAMDYYMSTLVQWPGK